MDESAEVRGADAWVVRFRNDPASWISTLMGQRIFVDAPDETGAKTVGDCQGAADDPRGQIIQRDFIGVYLRSSAAKYSLLASRRRIAKALAVSGGSRRISYRLGRPRHRKKFLPQMNADAPI